MHSFLLLLGIMLLGLAFIALVDCVYRQDWPWTWFAKEPKPEKVVKFERRKAS